MNDALIILFTFVNSQTLNKMFTMVNSEEFSNRLQKIFEHYDLNASAFADKIDVGRASISHLLSGRNKPSLDFVMRVVKTFPEVELYWLLNGKGEFPKQDSKTDIVEESSTSTKHQDSKNQDPENSSLKSSEDIIPSNSDDIERIVIFFKNGSFKSYTSK